MQTSDITTYTLHAHSVDAPTSVYFELDLSWFIWYLVFVQSRIFWDFQIEDSENLANATQHATPKSNKIFVVACFSGLHSNSPVVFHFVKAPILLCYLLFILLLCF